MKLVCDREKMHLAFQTAASVAPARSPKPILQNVKLEVTAQGGEFSATDTELGVRSTVAGMEVEKPGTVILPVSRFGSILRENSDEKLRIESTGQLTIVRGDRSEFRLPAINADEFPEVARFTDTKFFEIPARLLKELVRRTLYATDTETGRYALGGVLLDFGPNSVTAVGTDGRRLAKMEGPVTAHGGAGPSDTMTIVPARAMQLIDRALSDQDAEIQVCARANDLLVRSPRVTIYSRLVEGRFPRWRDVIPRGSAPIAIDVEAGLMLAAVRQAAIVANEETKGIDFTFGNGKLLMSGSTADVGEAKVEIQITYTGEPLTISLNHRYVSDFLKVFEPTRLVKIDLIDSDSPAVFTTDDSYTYVVMPLNRAGK